MFEIQRAAADLPGAEGTVYPDGALRHQHASPNLVTITSLSATSAGPSRAARTRGLARHDRGPAR
jgi:hypothetical protein